MGELKGAGDVATNPDIGEVGLQPGVGFYGSVFAELYTQFFQSKALNTGRAAGGNKDFVERKVNFFSFTVLGREAIGFKTQGSVCGQYFNPFRDQVVLEFLGHITIFPGQNVGTALYDSDPAAHAVEGLGHFDSDRSRSQNQQTLRQGSQIPEGVAGDKVGTFNSGNGGNGGGGAGGDGYVGGGENFVVDFDLPRGEDLGIPRKTIHIQGTVAFDGVVRFYFFDGVFDPFHDLGKFKSDIHFFNTIFLGLLGLGNQGCGFEQGLGWNAAGIEAVATHFVFFDQSGLGLQGTAQIGR